MRAGPMRDHLHDRMLGVSPDLFEILCKMVLERRLDTESLQVTAFRQDDGIDIEGVIDEELLRVNLGAQVKRYDEGNTVGTGDIQRFSGALDQANHHVGTYLTSSSFTQPAVQTAESLQINLVDGEALARTMVRNEIGVEATTDSYEIDDAFWRVLEEPERTDAVPSNEVPLANSFETLRRFLNAIDATDGTIHEIDEEVDGFESRHADLYGTAGWLLGFVHQEPPTEVNGREVRRWGLTKNGVRYLRLHERGETEAARDLLVEAIRQVEIIQRVLKAVEDSGELPYDELRETVARETTLSESSVNRRSSTVAQWLCVLPEIEERPDGHSKKFVRI